MNRKMIAAYLTFNASLALFAFLGHTMTGPLFLSLVAGAAAYHIGGRLGRFPGGKPTTLMDIGEALVRTRFLKDSWRLYKKRDLQNVLRHTGGTMLIMTWVLHLYLVPLLLSDTLGLGITRWWIDFTDPIVGRLGGLSPSVQHFTRDLIAFGYSQRVPIVRHVHGVVFACLIVFVLWSVLRFRSIVEAPMNMAKAAARTHSGPKPFKQKISTYFRIAVQLLLCPVIIYFGIHIIFFRDGIWILRVSNEDHWASNTLWFGGTVHVDNMALLDIAWLAPLISHGFFLGFVLALVGMIAFVLESQKVRAAQ